MSSEIENNIYRDTYGHEHFVDISSQMTGGQGIVWRTQERNLAIKAAFAPNSQDISRDTSRNEKYLDLRILPIPEGLNITLPQAVLQDVEGYVMTLLDGMCSLKEAFSLSTKVFKQDSNKENEEYIEHSNRLYLLGKDGNKRAQKLFAYGQGGGLRRRYMAYMKVAAMLARLHTAGLVYCDFSPQNVFISKNQEYENVWLIDGDNLAFAENLTKGGYYTPGFAAPELMTQGGGCSMYSDCFAYAVTFFQQLFDNHPFEGKAYNEMLDHSDYFADEVDNARNLGQFAWVLDSEDDSNDGRKNLLLPPEIAMGHELQQLFQSTFSYDGCNVPETRTTMLQWAYETAWAYDNTIWSAAYGMDYLADDGEYWLCPYDDAVIPTVRLCSYLLDKDNGKKVKLWQYTHELTYNQKIKVPERIVTGFQCQHQENLAFELKKSINGLEIISLLDAAVAFCEVSNPQWEDFRYAGSFMAKKQKFYVRCESQNGQVVLIEGILHE